MLDVIIQYVKPELVVVSVALYFIGLAIKKSETIKDKFIPFILGGIGIVLCSIYVLATCTLGGYQDVLLAIFTALVQGVLVAALSNYVDQLIKQSKKLQ